MLSAKESSLGLYVHRVIKDHRLFTLKKVRVDAQVELVYLSDGQLVQDFSFHFR